MAPAVDKTIYELHVLRAAADGVEPALLLRAPGRKAEYLFNVPDGFSRLALERKLTPSARLSCVLLTSLLPSSTGGFGGLFLRLKHDGHGQVQVIGPQGSSGIIHSLRHICRWRHPKVFVSECCNNGPLPVFEDEHTVIVPLLAGDQSTGCPWCFYASSETSRPDPLKETKTTFEEHDDSSSCSDFSGSSVSSAELEGTSFLQSASGSQEGDSFERRLSIFNSHNQKGKDVQSKGLDAAGTSNYHFSYGALATSRPYVSRYTEEDGYDREGYKSILPQRRKRDEAVSKQLVVDEEMFFEHVKSELDKAKTTRPGQHSRRHSGGFSSRNKQAICNDALPGMGIVQTSQLGLTTNVSPHHDIKETAAQNGSPRSLADVAYTTRMESEDCPELQCSTVLPGSAFGSKLLYVHSMKPYHWLISNLQQNELPQLPDESNPVYGLTPSGHVSEISSLGVLKESNLKNAGGCDLHGGQPARVLGYVCYLRKLNAAIFIVDCRGVKCLESLRRHPALGCIYHTSGSLKNAHRNGKPHIISAAVHLTPYCLVQSSDYQMWMRSFSSPVHVVMTERSPEFGFQSSLATLKRLNKIHQHIFPLPPNVILSPRARQPMRKMTKNKGEIVDAVLSMALTFSKEGTTLSYSNDDNSVSTSAQQTTSLDETSQQTQDLLLSKVDVQRSDSIGTSHFSSNALAAAGIKRTLLKEKQGLSSIATAMQVSRNVSIDTILSIHAMNGLKEDGVCGSSSLPIISSGNEDSSQLCTIEDRLGKEADKAFNAHGGEAKQVVLNEEQQKTSLLKASRNHDLTTQTGGLVSEPKHMKLHDLASEFQLFFLGTGCAEPSKKRGSSGILLQVRGAQGAILLDAGEGVTGQLFRRFGCQGARTIISSLQCLWLSHKHGDHVLGTLSILHNRSMQDSPLMVIGPHKVWQWLSEVRNTCATAGCSIPRFTYVHCDELSDFKRYRDNQQHAKQLLAVLDAMQLHSMRSVKVFHCHDAYGIILNGRYGWRLVYSGDTRPCKQLIEAGLGCTLLIHEATFEDSLVEQAKQKRHSTVSEAVEVGWSMQAQHIILTHFSQRYPEMVAINSDHDENVSLAFDGMVVTSGLLGPLGKLLPLIRIACQKTVNDSLDMGQQGNEVSLMPRPIWHHESRTGAQQKTVSCLINGDAKKSAEAKHKRWSSDSDGEAESQGLKDHPMARSIRWSSDSGEETPIPVQGDLLMRDVSKEPTSEMPSGYCRGENSPDSLKKPSGSNAMKTATLNSYSSDILETSGPFGGKHLRWNDSNSEDD